MKNKFIKLCSTFLVATFLISPLTVFATTYAGDSFSVTLACGNIEGAVNFSASNATITGGTGDWCDRGKSYTVTAKATAAGTATISMVGVDATNVDDLSDYSGKTIASKSITVSNKSSGGSSSSSGNNNTQTQKPTVNYSKDNNLKSLTVSEGTLSPKFSAGTTSYTVELGSSVTSLKVSATANDSKASVKGTGTKTLEPGENTIKITVTAENGNPKVYTINAIVDETPLVFLPYNGTELGVVRNLKDVPKLDGFKETKVTIDGNETKSWSSSTRNVTLIYLQNNDSKDFYIYDESKGVVSIYKPLGILGNNLGIVDIPHELQEKSAMIYGDVLVDGVTLKGWTYENESFKNFSLIYAMDEFGNYNYYQYEKTQNTLQLYSGAAPILQEEYDAVVNENATLTEERDNMTLYFYIACGVAVVSFVSAIIGLVNANRYKNRLLTKKTVTDEVEETIEVVEEPTDVINDNNEEVKVD